MYYLLVSISCVSTSFLAEAGLSHVSAICHLQIAPRLPDLHISSMPKLEGVIRGIKSHQAKMQLAARPRLGHSFGIKAATTASLCGISEAIKILESGSKRVDPPNVTRLFPGYEAIAWSTVVKKNGIYIFLYFEIYEATGGGSKYFRMGSLYFSTLLKN